jgi:hypothetical protein
MATSDTTAKGWHVLDREGGVLWREYRFAGNGSQSTTFVFRGKGDALIVVSPGRHEEPSVLDELSEFGKVTALVASNSFHWLGQALWRKHFPEAKSYAPADGVARLAKKMPGVQFETLEALAPVLGDNATVTSPAGLKVGNAFATVRAKNGTFLYPSDLLANIPEMPPQFVIKMLMSMTDSAPGYRLFRPAVWLQVKDKSALRSWFDQEFSRWPTTTMVPAHGPPMAGPELIAQTKALLAKM